MYCASCGNQTSPGLNYCNRCGAKTAKGDSGEKPINPLSYLITALCILGGSGFILFVGLIAILLDKSVAARTITAISFFYLAGLTLTNYMILRQISKLVNNQIETKKAAQESRPVELHSHRIDQLEAPRQPVTSVTEHTTRTLEEVSFKNRQL